MDRKVLANLILCMFIGVFCWLGLEQSGSALTSKGLFVSDPAPSLEAVHILPRIELKKYAILTQSGNKVGGDFVIWNNSQYDIEKVDILCEFFDTTGKYRDRSIWVLHNIFKAGEEQRYTATHTEYINSKAGSVTCKITDVQSVSEPFFTMSRSHFFGDQHKQGGSHTGHE